MKIAVQNLSDGVFPKDIIQRIEKDYPRPKDRQFVLSSLIELINEYGLTGNRIPRCILYLSKNGVKDFKLNLNIAKIDWRDVIGYAEYENEIHTYNFNRPFEVARIKPGEKF